MKIDWKHLAQTKGYKSLKACIVKDRERNHRSKESLHRLFFRVISIAKSHAYHSNRPIHEILDEWEDKRDYWWLSYYNDIRLVKPHNGKLKPLGIKGIKKYYRKEWHDSKGARLHRCNEVVKSKNRNPKRNGRKSRWHKNDYRRNRSL